MKKIQLILLVLFSICCKAQEVPLYPSLESYKQSGVYYKDTESDLNKFVGTWRYQKGDTSFTIVLTKKTHSYYTPNNCYFDMIIGEYEYIENGKTIINTLPQLYDKSINDFYHNLNDGYLLFGQRSPLDPSIILDKGMTIGFKNPSRAYINAYARISYHDNSIPTLNFNLIIPMQIIDGDDLPIDFMIPDGIHTLTKIN